MIKQTRILFLLIVSTTVAFSAKSQCANPEKVTADNILSITDPYQLIFIHEIPKNRVDSLVPSLLSSTTKSLIHYRSLIEAIAATRSKEGFLLLYVGCLHPQVVEDMNAMNTLCAHISGFGGPEMLNKYYLKGKIVRLGEESDWQYKQRVLRACQNLKPDPRFCRSRNVGITPDGLKRRVLDIFDENDPSGPLLPASDEDLATKIHNPYQLSFLHRHPITPADSLVHMFRFGPFDLGARARTDSLTAHNTRDIFLLMYVCCALQFQKHNSNNSFHAMANQLRIWGAFRKLNALMDYPIATDLPEDKFNRAVYEHAKKIGNIDLQYRHCPTEAQLYEADMAGVDFGPVDRKIIRIIRQNANLNKPGRAAAITRQVMQLPEVEDVLWDGCYEKLAIYPAYYHLMVTMNVGDRKAERSYSLKGATFRYIGLRWRGRGVLGRVVETNPDKLSFHGAGFSPGAIAAARAYCAKKAAEQATE